MWYVGDLRVGWCGYMCGVVNWVISVDGGVVLCVVSLECVKW